MLGPRAQTATKEPLRRRHLKMQPLDLLRQVNSGQTGTGTAQPRRARSRNRGTPRSTGWCPLRRGSRAAGHAHAGLSSFTQRSRGLCRLAGARRVKERETPWKELRDRRGSAAQRIPAASSKALPPPEAAALRSASAVDQPLRARTYASHGGSPRASACAGRLGQRDVPLGRGQRQ